MNERLQPALDLVGYDKPVPLHWKSNLVRAILNFAVGTKDAELEAQCEAELGRITEEIADTNQRV